MNSRDLLVLAVGALLVALSTAGSRLFPGSWWGLHLWSFLPAWSFLLALVVVAAAVYLALRPPRLPRARARHQPPRGASMPAVVIAGLFSAAAWIFRVRHILLGDGIPLVQHLATGLAFHPREPLTYIIQAALYRFMNAIAPAPDPELTAARGVAAGAIAAGCLFSFIAWSLAGEILNRWNGVPDEPRALPAPVDPLLAAGRDDAAGRRLPQILLTLVFLTQGYALLFFGYVENYAFLVTAVAFTLLAGLKAARGAWPLWVPGVGAVLATALHIMGALLFPGWLLLVALRLPARRRRIVIDGAVVALAFVVTFLLLGRLQSGYSWVGTIFTVGRVTTTSGIAGINRSYLGSSAHLRDFANEHWLLGPFALFLFVPAALRLGFLRRRLTSADLYVGANGLLWLVTVSRLADSNLGYARDWDLQTAAGVSFSVGGLFLLGGSGKPSLSNARLLAIALVFSMFQFVPWVAVNASAERAVRRAAKLPLGYGRSEVLVGTWYQRENRLDEAEAWYRKAIQVYPQSHAAWGGAGSIAFHKGRYDRAAHLYGVAIKLKPDVPLYHAGLVSSLERQGLNAEALREFETLLALDPADATTWAQYADLLRKTGRPGAARDAVRHARQLAPENALARKVEAELEAAPADSGGPVPTRESGKAQ